MDEEYLNVYENEHLKFKNESSTFALKRCLLLNQYQSYKNHSSLDSCILLQEQFKTYCDHFDSRRPTTETRGETLKSGLSKVDWRELLDNQPCTCDSVSTKEFIASVIKKSEYKVSGSVETPKIMPNDTSCEPSGSLIPRSKPSKWNRYKDKSGSDESDIKTGIYHQRIGGKINKNRYEKTDTDRMDESDQKSGIYYQRVGGKFKKWNQSDNDTGETSQYKNRKRAQDDEYDDSKSGIYNKPIGGKFKKWNLSENDEPYIKRNKPQDDEDSTSGIYNQRVGGKFKKWNQPEDESETGPPNLDKVFKTASNMMETENQENRYIRPPNAIKKSLGGKKSVLSKFVSPVQSTSKTNSQEDSDQPDIDERLKNIDSKMIELIKNEIIDHGTETSWDDIAGLHFAKHKIQEIVVWPMLRPDIFTGLRRPPKGILLFGPPGTGKTLIGKCIASQSKSTFFSISASSLTSKWMGEGEKMVRALFAVARVHQPAVVFIDEIDSLLSQRSETEHECSRRMKTEFLVQLDGAGTGEEDRILVIGATNRPQELDEAARRRLVKRLYIPLPDNEARAQIVTNLMKKERNSLNMGEIEKIAELTDGFSGADMKNLCQDACLGPIRSIDPSSMANISAENVRPVSFVDFQNALKYVKSSVSSQDLEQYIKWDGIYGSGIGEVKK